MCRAPAASQSIQKSGNLQGILNDEPGFGPYLLLSFTLTVKETGQTSTLSETDTDPFPRTTTLLHIYSIYRERKTKEWQMREGLAKGMAKTTCALYSSALK